MKGWSIEEVSGVFSKYLGDHVTEEFKVEIIKLVMCEVDQDSKMYNTYRRKMMKCREVLKERLKISIPFKAYGRRDYE